MPVPVAWAWRRSRSRIISARKSSPAPGSPAKRALLEVLGVKHVIDSRRADFAEDVMELTDGAGVDVVLNALSAEAIPMGLSCLAQFGRFIEIGKRDIYQNSRIPLWPLRKNASFHVVAMDAIFSGDEARTRDLLEQDRRAGRTEGTASAAVPLVPGLPHRCRLPPDGAGQAHRQGDRFLPGTLRRKTRRSRWLRPSR